MNTKSNHKVIFVMGVEHSGTTILHKMLGQHPDICWFSQFSMRGGEVPTRIRMPLYRRWNLIGRRLFPPSWKKIFGIRTKIFPVPMEPHKIWDYLLPNEKQFFDESDYNEESAERMRNIVDLACDYWKKDNHVIKLPRLTRATKLLARVFPDAYFVYIIRDGKAVAFSNEKKFLRGGGTPDEALRNSAQFWKDVVDYFKGSEKRIEGRLITIRYADLCADVHGHLREILEFAGIPTDNSYYERFPKTLEVTNERYFKTCTPEQKVIINDTIGDTLVEFGYSKFS